MTIYCLGACTVKVIQELSLPPLQLTPAEGAEIAGAVLLVWAVGWGFRQLIKLLQNTGSEKDEET